MANNKKIAKILGKKGGKKTLAKHGIDHYKKIGKKGGQKSQKRNDKGRFC